MIRSLFFIFAFAASAAAEVDYLRDVRPILADACFNCHGFDEGSRKAKLRLDTSEGATALRDGVAAIVPGNVDESELLYRITTEDADEQMPPPEHAVQLSAAQKQTLRQWIEEGAQYRGHWAFEPVEQSQASIDELIGAQRTAAGLAKNPPAPKRTLIRRVSLDLTGLPPTPQAVRDFVADDSPDAYAKVVDRLIASPRYGERMAMWWLDGARYADSHGFQADWERYQWPWRDWVINAFNSNQPFDEFTVEQLAGDMLPDARTSQIVATGFNRNHRINTEGGALDAEWLIENVMDRVDTVGSVWLGLTLGCARCHDHKYDPISQKEFYQLFAYFHNVPEQGKGPGKQGNFEPTIKVPVADMKEKVATLDVRIAAARKQLEVVKRAAAEQEPRAPRPWQVVRGIKIRSTGGATFTEREDGSFLASGKNPEKDTFEVSLPPATKSIGAIMIEALPDASLVGGSVGRASNGNFVLTGISAPGLKFATARANYEQKSWPVNNVLDGKAGSGWAVDGNSRAKASAAVFALNEAVELKGKPVSLKLEFGAFSKHAIGRLRISVAEDPGAPLPGEQAVPKAVREAQAALAALQKQRTTLQDSAPSVMVMREMDKPRDTFVLERGEYDKHGEKVDAGLPAALPPMPDGAPNNRLGFAKWVVAPENPLTARVQVNRFWELLFGLGLVKSSENFGTQAEPPSHPQLLDALAAEFVASGWDTKALLKKIVTSETYKQSSKVTPELLVKDPENVYLARGPRLRVQAETVRDSALYMAGLLKEQLGGPSVYPYQPPGIWSEFNFYGNLRNYKHAKDDGLYRRSMYTIWKRTAAPPGMTLFDMPSREICTVKRSRTNTPLQALALMNDVTYVEASRAFAERMIAEGGEDLKTRIAYGFEIATAREATEQELLTLGRGFQRRWKYYKENPEAAKALIEQGESKPDPKHDPAALAALTTVASVILNLDESITKE